MVPITPLRLVPIHRYRQQGNYADPDILINEETHNVLLKRYHELLPSGVGRGGVEQPPYDIETYLTEIDTGQIDACLLYTSLYSR